MGYRSRANGTSGLYIIWSVGGNTSLQYSIAHDHTVLILLKRKTNLVRTTVGPDLGTA